MAKHNLNVTLPGNITLRNNRLEVNVKINSEHFGTLLIGKQGCEWWPRSKNTHTYELTWNKLNLIFRQEGKPVEYID